MFALNVFETLALSVKVVLEGWPVIDGASLTSKTSTFTVIESERPSSSVTVNSIVRFPTSFQSGTHVTCADLAFNLVKTSSSLLEVKLNVS